MRDLWPVVLGSHLLFAALTVLIPLWRTAFGLPRLVLYGATGTSLDEWNRWDARWYMDLARLGYSLRGPDGYKNVAFFPLYPLLTRTVHDVLALAGRALLGPAPAGQLDPPYLVAGMIVSNVCAVAALAFLYVLVRLDFGRATAQRTVTLLALSPMALFLCAAYSEGTFLLGALAFFYALRLERWWQAGLWGLLAAATRPPGAVLLVPFLMAWAAAHPVVGRTVRARLRLAGRGLRARVSTHLASWARADVRAQSGAQQGAAGPLTFPSPAAGAPSPLQARTPRRRAGDVGVPAAQRVRLPDEPANRRPQSEPPDRWPHHRWQAEVRRAARNVVPAVAIPLGLVLFMAFLYKVFGDPLWFSRAQRAWLRTFAPPWETLYISAAWPLGDMLRHTVTVADGYSLEDLAYAVAGLTVTWLAWRRLPRAQGVYVWLLWLVVLSSPAMLTDRQTGEPHRDVLMSVPRMLLMMFPLFTYLGLRRPLYPRLVAFFTLMLVVYTGIFLTGGWVS